MQINEAVLTPFTIARLLCLVALLAGSNRVQAQFKPHVVQSYLYYNKARLALVAGKTDSAATYMEQSILLNNQNDLIRYEARDMFMKAGRYRAALADFIDLYRDKELPDDITYFFDTSDSATYRLAIRNPEIRHFIDSYDSLKMEHRMRFGGSPNPFKDLVNRCHIIDQFTREYASSLEESGDTTRIGNKVFTYADKENIKAMGEYLKHHSLPASTDDPTVHHYKTFVLFLHWIRDTATLRGYPGWQAIHDSVLKNVYEGRYDVRQYVKILESQHVVFTNKLLFGIYTNKAPTPDHPNRRTLQAALDDVPQVDQRRKEWLQPTLYEEYQIKGEEVEFPAAYKR